MLRPEVFGFFADLVRKTSGISLGKEKEYLIESRLGELARVLGMKDVEELYEKVRGRPGPELLERIVEAMTTNETYFFRDQHPFEALRKEVIPALMERNKAERSLRFWSAAASTGQEAYSIALVVKEYFPELSNWKVRILGTDISKSAIEKAAQGRYTQVEVNRGLPVTFLIKYFKQNGALWMLAPEVKELVEFQTFNLLSSTKGLGVFDCIFLRYVLIYFDKDTKQAVLNKIERSLRPGGYLFLGATETPVGLSSQMRRVTIGRSVCWQKAG